MQIGVIERKVLGALIAMMNDDNEVNTTASQLAKRVGYQTMGGSITMSLKLLEMKNMIVIESPFARGGKQPIQGKIRVLAV